MNNVYMIPTRLKITLMFCVGEITSQQVHSYVSAIHKVQCRPIYSCQILIQKCALFTVIHLSLLASIVI